MTLALTATVLADFAAVRLEVTGAAAGEAQVTRSDVNGAALVRLLPGQEPSSGVLIVTDYEPALHAPVAYTVTDGGGFTAAAPAVTLAHPFPVVTVAVSPNHRAEVRAFTDTTETSDDGSTVHRVLDSPWPVAVQGTLSTRDGSLAAWCDTYETAAELRAVAGRGETVLVRHPEHYGMDAYATVRRVTVAPRGELVATDLGPTRRWTVTLEYLEGRRPSTPLLAGAGWTVAEVVATYATVADVVAAFATVRDLTVGP